MGGGRLQEVVAHGGSTVLLKYFRSSPCDHSPKRPAQDTTTFVKLRLNHNLNFVMKSSHKLLLL